MFAIMSPSPITLTPLKISNVNETFTKATWQANMG